MRLIDADAIEWESGTDPCDPCADMCFVRAENIKEMPTIETEHTKKGIWLVGLDEIKCSVCEWRYSRKLFFEAFIFAHYFPYCPFCGTKMELEYDEYVGRR